MKSLDALFDERESLVIRGGGVKPSLRWIVVEITTQRMRCFDDRLEVSCFEVSTSKRGAGCRVGTFCTPLGWHQIAEKIGENSPPGTIFKGRVAGAVASSLESQDDDDLITSRILWLDGLQPGFNRGGEVDSKARYIYVHGTAQEQLIGRAVSHGCVRMRNDEIIALFDWVGVGVPVYICQCVM